MNSQVAHLFASQKKKVISSEPVRICELPTKHRVYEDLTEDLKTPHGEMRLRPVQSEALTEAKHAGGLIALIGCGHGKTLITLLLGRVMRRKRALLLVPASLREKTKEEALAYREHFDFEIPEIISYQKLSRPSGLRMLQDFKPDLVICDEAHHLKDMSSVRTKRLAKYLVQTTSCAYVAMSGTLYNRSIGDIAHLADWALEERSPFPRNTRDVEIFDAVLTGEANRYQYGAWTPMKQWGDDPRSAVYKRICATSGVVVTVEAEVGSSLQIHTRTLKIPTELKEAIRQGFDEGPMSETLSTLDVDFDFDAVTASQHLWQDADAFALRALSQMNMGILYYWDWPDGEPDTEWLEYRRAWNRALNKILEFDIPDFDSRYLIESGFTELPEEIQRVFISNYTDWQTVKSRPIPPKKTVWVSRYLIEDVLKWTKAQKSPYIIWVDFVAFGKELSSTLNIPYYGGGATLPDHAENCIMSIKSHATGKNLQAWSVNLIVHPLSDAALSEQLIARTHRQGQSADTVHVYIYKHSIFGSAAYRAYCRAKIISETTGQPQRLIYADRVKDDI